MSSLPSLAIQPPSIFLRHLCIYLERILSQISRYPVTQPSWNMKTIIRVAMTSHKHSEFKFCISVSDSCFVTWSCCCDQIHKMKQIKEGRVYFNWLFKQMRSIMVGTEWQQEQKAANCIETVRKQSKREMNTGVQLTFSFWCSLGFQHMKLYCPHPGCVFSP